MDLAVRHRVHRTAARQGDPIAAVLLVERVQQVEKRLLVHRLNRTGQILVPLQERILGVSRRAQQLFEFRGKQRADFR